VPEPDKIQKVCGLRYYDTFYSGSHLSTPNAQAYSSGNDGQREAAQADQDAYP